MRMLNMQARWDWLWRITENDNNEGVLVAKVNSIHDSYVTPYMTAVCTGISFSQDVILESWT